MGIRRGYSGLISGDIFEMDVRSVSDIIHRGGTVLYTARSEEFKTEEGMQKAIQTCKEFGIEGVVVIGGDGSFRGASDLSARGIPCVGLPGVYDGSVDLRENGALGVNLGDILLGVAALFDKVVEPLLHFLVDVELERLIRLKLLFDFGLDALFDRGEVAVDLLFHVGLLLFGERVEFEGFTLFQNDFLADKLVHDGVAKIVGLVAEKLVEVRVCQAVVLQIGVEHIDVLTVGDGLVVDLGDNCVVGHR